MRSRELWGLPRVVDPGSSVSQASDLEEIAREGSGQDMRSNAGVEKESSPSVVADLRAMSRDVERLSSSIEKHLESFKKSDGSFKTLPDSNDGGDISVGSTCTVLMALLGAKRLDVLSKSSDLGKKEAVRDLFKRVVAGKWGSSGLPDGNAFTTAIVVRTAGFVVESNVFGSSNPLDLRHPKYPDEKGASDQEVADRSLGEVIESKARAGDRSFKVLQYPEKTTLAYWFVDGVTRGRVVLGGDIWSPIATWALQQFHGQLVYVSAKNDSLMDPPELAMAACLINAIRRLCDAKPELTGISKGLPSAVELTFAVKQVLAQQSDSGIWHKYFPLFHFPTGQGAADYCFSFEFLEAVLIEFGSEVLRDKESLQHIKRALTWCDNHVLHFVDGTKEYRGWNSGGEVRKLAAGMPEAWATATVHMFLTQLDSAIKKLLDEIVLKQFGKDRIGVEQEKEKLGGLIDVDITFPGEPGTTLLTVLKEELICNAESWSDGRKASLGTPRSALLFGPPGTSKTSLAKSIALYLGWPIVIITPSEFLGRGLEQVHAQVDEKFRDLMDLRKAVVFFDEMDALAQTREEKGDDKASLDVTRQLLTTSMLPKLADLWDKRQVVFLMATNHKQQLDPAITRANRFDLLLCVAPPRWSKKRAATKLSQILGIESADEVETELIRLVNEGSPTEKLLDLFTVTELGVFFDHVRRTKKMTKLLAALREYSGPSEFSETVLSWAKRGIVLRKGAAALKEYKTDVIGSLRQYSPEEVIRES